MNTSTKVAVVQGCPVIFDLQKSLSKTAGLIAEAAASGARLVLFPEAWLSGYPRGISFGTLIGSRSASGREQWLRYWESALEIPGPETVYLAQLAEKHQLWIAIGVTERDPNSKSLYCSLLYFAPNGQLAGKHRKIKPTAAERIIWGEGNGTDLVSFDSDIGKIGGLICWENYMPFARMALYLQGVELYLAPTADSRDTWQASMQHIACEGRCFVLTANQVVQKKDYPADFQPEIENYPALLCRGGSAIISPMGQTIAGPLFDKEGILYASLDRREIVKSKLDFDVVGHYSRPDIFEFRVNGQQPMQTIKRH